MLVLSSPSGAGKSTISRLLLEQETDLDLSISVTTRARRQSEVDGVHYHFIDGEKFAAMRERGELLEWAEVHGPRRPRKPVEAALYNRDMLFDIDWQGTQQIARHAGGCGGRLLYALQRTRAPRLRAEDDRQIIARRLANAREIGHWREYDYVIVNDDLQNSLAAVRAVLRAERLRRARQPALAAFVDRLLVEEAGRA
jgi:guanylate kinase